jgi:transcriptional regulator with XRE-family HTH domain
MVKKSRINQVKEGNMKDQVDLKSILKVGKLTNELDLERALILDNKLRILAKDNPELIESRKLLRSIIKEYEQTNWSKDSSIDEQKIKESDTAQLIAEQERVFLENRKYAIKEKLEKLKITQQELGKILGHGKTYMSELMNGVSPFSMRDLIILHRLFGIKLEKLIPTIISEKDRVRIKTSLNELNKPEIRFQKEDFVKALFNTPQFLHQKFGGATSKNMNIKI